MDKRYTTNLKSTFLVHAVMMTIFALIYIFIPVMWGDLTGCLSNKVPQVFRMFGTAILGLWGSHLPWHTVRQPGRR